MSEMTLETLIKRLKRLGKGEHYCGDIDALFLKVANKSEYTVADITGEKISKIMPYLEFKFALDKYKYGLEYTTNGKIRYVGTNDLATLIIK